MTTKNSEQITMSDAIATIQAEQEARLQEFQKELQLLQKRLGVHLEIHQIIVPVLNPGKE